MVQISGSDGDAAGQLTSLMTQLGVPEGLAGELTRATVAVAAIAKFGDLPEGIPADCLTPPAQAAADAADTDTETDQEGTAPTAEQGGAPGVKARAGVLVDAI